MRCFRFCIILFSIGILGILCCGDVSAQKNLQKIGPKGWSGLTVRVRKSRLPPFLTLGLRIQSRLQRNPEEEAFL